MNAVRRKKKKSEQGILITRRPELGIAKHHHKTSVHVILLMTVEERPAGMICDKLNLSCGSGWNKQDILEQAMQFWTAVHLANLKGMAVQVHWMVVHA
jgi:hypothetical protein